MRGILPFLLALAFAWPARGEVFLFDAPSGQPTRELTIYSTLDEGLAAPMIEARIVLRWIVPI